MKNKKQLKANLETIEEKIQKACDRSQRKREEITLLPITKYQSIDLILALYELGFFSFGESRIADLMEKKSQLLSLDLNWHLVGSLQTNKVSKLSQLEDVVIHSVDRIKLIEKLIGLDQSLKIFLQVNVSNESTKHGFSLENIFEGIEKAMQFNKLKIQGLMTMAPKDESIMTHRKCFERLRVLRDDLQEKYSIKMPYLSMGMSNDFEEAILEGSTLIRVGTALFKDLA